MASAPGSLRLSTRRQALDSRTRVRHRQHRPTITLERALVQKVAPSGVPLRLTRTHVRYMFQRRWRPCAAPQLENRIKTRRPAGEPIPHPGPPRRPRRASGKDGGVPRTTPAAPQRFRLPANAKTTTKVSSSVRENGPEQRKTAKRIRGKCHLPPTSATGMEGPETDRKTGRRSSLLRFPQNSGDGCRIPLTAMQVACKQA